MVASICSFPFFHSKKALPTYKVTFVEVEKALLTTATVTLFLGPQAGLVALIIHLFCSIIAILQRQQNRSWFFHPHSYCHIKEGFHFFHLVMKINIFVGLIFWMNRPNVQQVPLRNLLRFYRENIEKCLSLFFRITLLSPFVEEVVFRGFLLETLKEIQSFFVRMEKLDTIAYRFMRTILSAFLFALYHYHPLQGVGNIPILMATFLFGFYMGNIKEETGSLWKTTIIHSIINTSVCLRVILFGG